MMHKIILLSLCLLFVSVRLEAQCFPDRHSTNYYDGWISCETAPNPNPARPEGHFIMYDFGKTYKLGQMHIWNTNDPSRLHWGMQDVAIDYSLDGETWEHAGDFTLAQGTGLSTYEGTDGPFLFEVEARYLLITGLSNYGGECYGLSEVHISGEEVIVTEVKDLVLLECLDVTIYPNPFTEQFQLSIMPECAGVVRYSLYDALGHEIQAGRIELHAGESRNVEMGKELVAGAYILYLESGGKKVRRNIVKVERT